MARRKRFKMTKKETIWWQNHYNNCDIVEIEQWKAMYDQLYQRKREILDKLFLK